MREGRAGALIAAIARLPEGAFEDPDELRRWYAMAPGRGLPQARDRKAAAAPRRRRRDRRQRATSGDVRQLGVDLGRR